jgi:hypothetical protein
MMKNTCFIVLTICFITSCIPKDTSKWSYERINRYEESIKCTLGKKYSVEQRREMFPFDKAKKVLFIAFRNHEMFGISYPILSELIDTSVGVDEKLIILPKIEKSNCQQKEIIRKWRYSDVDTSQKFQLYPDYCAIESIELNTSQVDTLSNLLFNYQLNKPVLISRHSGCYSPRNAILFLNDKNQILALIEICFECGQTKYSFDKYNEKTWCCQLDTINSFFTSVGIKYGIEKRH